MSDSRRTDESSAEGLREPDRSELNSPVPRPPSRRAGVQRYAIGGLAGAAALLVLGQVWARAGGT